MSKCLNSADRWMLKKVSEEIQNLIHVDEEKAQHLMKVYDLEKYLQEDPHAVHHEEPSVWAKDIITRFVNETLNS